MERVRGFDFLRTFLSLYPSINSGVSSNPLTFSIVTQSPSFLESLGNHSWSVHGLPTSVLMGVSKVAVPHRNADQMRKNSF